MYCLSIDYKNADSLTRSAFSLTKRKILDLSKRLDGGLVALFTCNRGELYFEDEPLFVLSLLELDEKIRQSLVLYDENTSCEHLFRVICGMESMLVGEDDIARQIKKAYAFSLENSASSAHINLIFQKAFNCSKRVKSETMLSKTATSFSTLCARLAREYYIKNKCGGGILLVGASGELGGVIAKNIASYSLPLTVTKRSCKKSREAYENEKSKSDDAPLGDSGYTVIGYEHRYAALKYCDIIITATASPHLIFDFEKCKSYLRKNQLFIDLSVPFDIDRRISNTAQLVDIDYFRKIAEKNGEEKLRAVNYGEKIIAEELLKLDEIIKKYETRCKNAVFSDDV